MLLSASLFSKEIFYLMRSPKALLMGDAYTAIADDEYSLYYNPALLARNSGMSLTPLNPSFGLTNAYSDLNKFQNLPSGTSAASELANRFMDYPIYFSAGATPGFKMGGIGFNLFINNQSSLMFRNSIHPTLNLQYRYDRGFIAGFAYQLGNGAFASKKSNSSKTQYSNGQKLSLGFAVKHFNRQGTDSEYDLFGTGLLNTINNGGTSLSEIKSSLGFSEGDGWGYDLGLDYIYSSGLTTITAGASLQDLFGTYFKRTSGDKPVPYQPMIGNLGLGIKQDFYLFDYTLSFDLHPFLGKADLKRQIHVGTELSFPFISLLGGISEGYYSYGLILKFWPFKLTTGLYGTEIGASYKQSESKRFILYLSLFDFSIDL